MDKKCAECGFNTKENYFCCIACHKIIDFKCIGIKSKTTFDLIMQLKNLRYICDHCEKNLVSQTNLLTKMHDCVDIMHKLQCDLNVMSSKFCDRPIVDKITNLNINADDNKSSYVAEPRPVDQPLQNNICSGGNSSSILSKNHQSAVNPVHVLCDNFDNNKNKNNVIVDAAISGQKEQVSSVSSLPQIDVQVYAHKNKRKYNKKRADKTHINQYNNDEGQNKPIMSKNKAFQNNENVQDGNEVIIGTAAGGIGSIGAIPPRKWIFVSRLLPTVTDCEFKNYIKNNLRILDASCTRFEKNADYVSYKVGVPLECFEAVMKAEAWPEHLLIKEFNFNQKANFRGVRLQPRMRL